jgi:hypothetical protein
MPLWKWIRNQWDRAIGLAATALGAIALLLGWLGARDSLYPAQQIPFLLSGGLVGLFLLGVGCTAWISADLRDEWRNLDSLEQAIREGRAEPGAPTQAAPRKANG